MYIILYVHVHVGKQCLQQIFHRKRYNNNTRTCIYIILVYPSVHCTLYIYMYILQVIREFMGSPDAGVPGDRVHLRTWRFPRLNSAQVNQ